ncbi:MAG: creatininase family protein [Myxococcales bacterium]|nr:creatininase family protein [Myxococcales bacterium]
MASPRRSWSIVTLLLLGTACDGAPAPDSSMPPPTDPPTPPAAAPSAPAAPAPPEPQTPPSTTAAEGTLLWDLTWVEAEAVLTPEAVVVLPLGAASKEHGPHLRLKNDWLLAEYYKERVHQAADVVIVPTLGFHFYPAFVEYPGSTSLERGTSRDVVVQICRGLSRFGPRRFYVLNTGVSTVGPLQAAADQLAAEGILMTFTDILEIAAPVEQRISEQPGGTHADEIETSMMLYIAPETVDMSRAVRDWAPKTKPGFSRTPDGPGHYSKTGIWGDPTLATREKGEQVVERMVEGILADIEALRVAPLPTPAPTPEPSSSDDETPPP